MPESPPAGRTVVLLIDYDNLQICAQRDTPGQELDLQAVMSLAQNCGTVIVARAYAEWNHLTERLNCFRVGIEPSFAPVLRTEASGRNGGKSLADTVIVADGVDLLWRLSPDVFVLATSDKDMIPLVRLVKQRGSEVVVVGSDLTAVPLVEMANQFFTYRQLIADSEEERERERTHERERMRTAHLARRDEAMRSRETRRSTLRELEAQAAPRPAAPVAPPEEAAPRPTRRRREAIRVEPPVAPAAPMISAAPEPVFAPASGPTAGEQALLAGAAATDGAPTRRRRRRRRRSTDGMVEGQEQADMLGGDEMPEDEAAEQPAEPEQPPAVEPEPPVEATEPAEAEEPPVAPEAESEPAMPASNTPPAVVVPEMPAAEHPQTPPAHEVVPPAGTNGDEGAAAEAAPQPEGTTVVRRRRTRARRPVAAPNGEAE